MTKSFIKCQNCNSNCLVGADLPLPTTSHTMVRSIDKKELFIIGNYANKEIFKFSCPCADAKKCQWTKIKSQMGSGSNFGSVGIAVPQAWVDANC